MLFLNSLLHLLLPKLGRNQTLSFQVSEAHHLNLKQKCPLGLKKLAFTALKSSIKVVQESEKWIKTLRPTQSSAKDMQFSFLGVWIWSCTSIVLYKNSKLLVTKQDKKLRTCGGYTRGVKDDNNNRSFKLTNKWD